MIMMKKNIAKELAKQAKENGICTEWYKELITLTDKEDMLDMYVKGIDFCLANDYPTNQYIRSNFKGMMEPKGVFLDDKINLVNPKRCIALGTTQGCLNYDGYSTSEVFVKNDTAINITAQGHSFIVVDMFDNTQVSIEVDNDAQVCVNVYGGVLKQSVNGSGRIKVIKKTKKTY